MRGTPSEPRCEPGTPGLIPTYAGNTDPVHPGSAARRAHPHVCGEHKTFTIYMIFQMGSSPRMRGTQAGGAVATEAVGLIPTYAGNTGSPRRCCAEWWAHPHVCGEHSRSLIWPMTRGGSSPRMRGTLESLQDKGCVQGLIPTYAGNTQTAGAARRGRRAHPHVCGEHVHPIMSELEAPGSSPRMRGTL